MQNSREALAKGKSSKGCDVTKWVSPPLRMAAAVAHSKGKRKISLILVLYNVGQPTVILVQELTVQAMYQARGTYE